MASPPLSCFSFKLWLWHYWYQTWELHLSLAVLFHILLHRLHCETELWFQNLGCLVFVFVLAFSYGVLDENVKNGGMTALFCVVCHPPKNLHEIVYVCHKVSRTPLVFSFTFYLSIITLPTHRNPASVVSLSKYFFRLVGVYFTVK